MSKIIDISHHQVPSKINYKTLCSQLSMGIVRVQYGSRLIDRHYKTHISELEKYKVPFGVYAWVRGISNNDMRKEARDFHNRSKDLNPSFYVLDVEEKSMDNMREGINSYVDELRKLTNKKIGVYIANHLYKSFNLDLSKFDFVWIPHYGVNNGKANSKPNFPCDLHQYTDKGRLQGYSGNLDLNRFMNGRNIEFFTGVKTPPSINKPAQTVTNKLAIDGYWGNATTRSLQKSLKTPMDGVISGQYPNSVTRAISSCDFKTRTGSNAIKALQRKLGTKADGYIGIGTVKALQKHLGTYQDGIISKPSNMVKELQRRLNKGEF